MIFNQGWHTFVLVGSEREWGLSGNGSGIPRLVGLGIFAVAVASGVYWGTDVVQGGDAPEYRRLAENILEGHGFSLSVGSPYEPTARRAPGYPLFLALVYTVFGRSDTAVLWAQSMLWGFGCLLLARLVASIFDMRAGVLAAFIVAVHPVLARTAGEVLTESLYTVCMISLMFVFHRSLRTSSVLLLGFAGVLFGAATLIRPLTGAFLLFLWGGVWIWRQHLRSPVRSWLIMTAVGFLTLLPWTIRNSMVFGHFIPIQGVGAGVNVWLASLPYSDQPIVSWDEWDKALPRLQEKYPEMRVAAMVGRGDRPEHQTVLQLHGERILMRAAIARILGDPLGYLRSRARSYPHLWLYSGGSSSLAEVSFGDAWRRGDLVRLTAKVLFLAVFSLLPIGLAVYSLILEGLRREHYVLWAVPLLIAVVHVPLWIEYRYSIPAQPFLWGLASGAITSRLRRIAYRP